MKTQLLTLALLTVVCGQEEAFSGEADDYATRLSCSLPDKPWSERRKEIAQICASIRFVVENQDANRLTQTACPQFPSQCGSLPTNPPCLVPRLPRSA